MAFAGQRVVAAFFDHESKRSPYADPWEREYDWRSIAEGMPSDFIQLLEERALPWMTDDFRGQRMPFVTAVLWGEGDDLTSNEPWSEVFANGGFLMEYEILEPQAALAAWAMDCEFTTQQVTVARSLFERRMATGDAPVLVQPNEEQFFRVADATAQEKSRALLAAVGIVF